MVKKRAGADRLAGKTPAPLAVKYPETEFSRLQRAKIVEVDVAQLEHEQIWGIGRVTTLVPTEFRVKFYAQSERIWSAQEAQDEQKFVAACDGMVRAYKAMSSWAQAEGLQPVSQVKAIEAETHLGVMAIVKDEDDANQYLAIRKDVKQVWTVSEIAQLLNAGIGQAMAELKEKLPFRGAVVSVKQESEQGTKEGAQKAGGEAVGRGGASGFEDLENDLDVDAPSEMPKMFHIPDDVRKG
jgi:hypothetical protein